MLTDFRKLNAQIKMKPSPIPNISDLLRRLGVFKYMQLQYIQVWDIITCLEAWKRINCVSQKCHGVNISTSNTIIV
jgi:hypothetical protein